MKVNSATLGYFREGNVTHPFCGAASKLSRSRGREKEERGSREKNIGHSGIRA
jgi:hypothetical protein